MALGLVACGGTGGPGDGAANDDRPDNTRCLASRFDAGAELTLEPLVEAGTFTAPVGVVSLPTDDKVFYVLEQHGLIWRLERSGDGYERSQWVDLRDHTDVLFSPETCHECGLFSLAFHPDFAQNGYVYLSFTEGGEDGPPVSRLARFRSADDGESLVEDGAGELERESIYELPQTTNIHNGGRVAFGPDDFLYISFGDGGPGVDPDGRAQDPGNAFGTIVRLTDEGEPAPGNEVESGLPEVYAYGLRNPWQWSFDRDTGELWAGDVGQNQFEEINRIVNGGNYGWACREGSHERRACPEASDFEEPVWQYGRGDGQSVTGGYVYRGQAIDALYGTYLFSDFGSGVVWGLSESAEGQFERRQLLDTGGKIVSFGEDNDGELYLVDYEAGQVSRLIEQEADPDRREMPRYLSETGCVNPDDPAEPADGLIPYRIREPFWSDGAQKERYMALPNDAELAVNEEGDIEFPAGTVLVKAFHRNDRLIETRLLLHREQTGWIGHSYRWNDNETEAERVIEAEDARPDGELWHYPSSAECSQCHTGAAGDSLGPEVRQLDRAADDGGNQLDALIAMGLFEALPPDWQRRPPLVDSRDEEQPLTARARSYLHSNCSHCHRPGGTSQSDMDLRFETLPQAMRVCDVRPRQGDLGIEGARLLAPGEPERSLLWQRMRSEDEAVQMPPLSRHRVDQAGAGLIGEWIRSLEYCSGRFAPADEAVELSPVEQSGHLGEDGERAPTPAHWRLEEASPYYRIRLAGTDRYLHAEQDTPAVGSIEAGWWSAQWYPEVEGERVRWRNRWKEGEYLVLDPDSGRLRLSTEASEGLWRVGPVSGFE